MTQNLDFINFVDSLRPRFFVMKINRVLLPGL